MYIDEIEEVEINELLNELEILNNKRDAIARVQERILDKIKYINEYDEQLANKCLIKFEEAKAKSKEEIYNIAKEFIEKKAKIKMPTIEKFDDDCRYADFWPDLYFQGVVYERTLTYEDKKKFITINYNKEDWLFRDYIEISILKFKKDYKERLTTKIKDES